MVLVWPLRVPDRPHCRDTGSYRTAKARFSELVRRARSEGPQHVSVHGRDEAVIIAAEEFRRLSGAHTGRELIAAIQSSPYREIEIEPARGSMPVRDVSL